MDLMEVRRRMMGQITKKVVDTSPVIEFYGYSIPAGSINYTQSEGSGVTKIYEYPKQDFVQTLVTAYVTANIRVFKDGLYRDYWSWGPTVGMHRKVINSLSNGLAMTIILDNIDDSYAYLEETGQILFAGKNSPYYGYANINDMP